MRKLPLTYSVLLFASLLFGATVVSGQNVGININGEAPNASAILDLQTGNTGRNMGLLPPQVALTFDSLSSPVTSPATGLIVYNTSTTTVSMTNKGTWSAGVTPGYYYWNGTYWVSMQTKLSIPYYIQALDSNKTYSSSNWGTNVAFDPVANSYDLTSQVASTNSILNSMYYNDYTMWTSAAPSSGLALDGWITADFVATSYTVFNKFVGLVNCETASATIIVEIYKYTYTSGSSTAPSSGTLLGSATVKTSATVGYPSIIAIPGGGTLNPGDIIVIWSQVNPNPGSDTYYTIGGSLELATE
jgi:hypothetical protein